MVEIHEFGDEFEVELLFDLYFEVIDMSKNIVDFGLLLLGVVPEDQVGVGCHANVGVVVESSQEHSDEHVILVDLEGVLLFLL